MALATWLAAMGAFPRREKGGWIRTSTLLDANTTTALDELHGSVAGGYYRLSFAAGLGANVRAAIEAIFSTE